MVTTPVLVTYEESLLRTESSREEVIHGELHVIPLSTAYHNDIIQTIVEQMSAKLDQRLRAIWDTGFLIAERPRLTYRVPDLAIVDRAALKLVAERREVYVRFAPQAVIEVLSPSNRKGNVGQLLEDYLDLGVNEIIFIDPAERSVRINDKMASDGHFTVAGIPFELNSLL